MGGSFESGAGDDPDELFASVDEDEEESEDEEVIDAESEQEPQPETTKRTTTDTDSQEERSTSSGTAAGTTADASAKSQRESPMKLEFDSPEEIDGARLAREFVPTTYDKPHAWALGRDGVNDGRSEKKTFFLQSSVLDLEAACSQQVNEILDGNVPLTDLRELALIIAYHQPELLAEAAQEWGAESA